MKTKTSTKIILGIALLFLVLVLGGCTNPQTPPANPLDSNTTDCPKDLKTCPDGTTLGREGPNCEFPACPNVDSNQSGFLVSGYAHETACSGVGGGPPDWNPCHTNLLSNQTIRVYQNGVLIKEITTDATGHFETRLPAGNYEFIGNGPGYLIEIQADQIDQNLNLPGLLYP